MVALGHRGIHRPRSAGTVRRGALSGQPQRRYVPQEPRRIPLSRRRLRYVVLMGTCVTLFVLSWAVVRFYSIPAAVAMSVVAMVIPPFAAIVANWGNTDEYHPDTTHRHNRPAGTDPDNGHGPGDDDHRRGRRT